MEVKVETRQSIADEHVAVMLKEYELANSNVERAEEYGNQILAVGVTALGLVAGYILNQGAALPIGVAWLAPLLFIVVYALLLFVSYGAIANLGNCRVLTERINAVMPELGLTRHEPNYPGNLFFSLRRGNGKVRTLYFTLIGIAVGLFLVVSSVAFHLIYSASHLGGTLFVLFYGSLIILELVALSGLLVDLPQLYRELSAQMLALGRFPRGSEFQAPAAVRQSAWAALLWLLPRPFDFLVKGVVFWYGYAAAVVIAGFSEIRRPLVNLLFRDAADWATVADVPLWAWLALGVLYFLIEEALLQQAKLLWDDIRDIKRDQGWPLNRRRAVASGVLSRAAAMQQLLVRGLLALSLGYLLGGPTLLGIFLLILLHQGVYVLWGKPRGGQHPRRLLFILSFNLALRFLAGIATVIGAGWSQWPFVGLFVVFYFAAMGGMAAIWRVEAEHQRDTQQPLAIRPQSPYYLADGEHWQHLGLLAAVFVTVAVMVVHVLAVTSNTAWGWYGQRDLVRDAVNYTNVGLIGGGLAIIGLIIVVTLLIELVLYTLRALRSVITRVVRKVKGLFSSLAFSLCIIYFLQALINRDVMSLLWCVLFFNLGYLFLYEGMTYDDYTLAKLRARFPLIIRAWYLYFFNILPGVSLKEVIRITRHLLK